MLEILSCLTKTISEFAFWLHNKEQEAAIRRIKTLDKITRYYAKEIMRLSKEKESVEIKYFSGEE